ncbi:MAG: histidine kinase N-terminal 7TM domain-containing protein, partial [Candidatus Hodarchaeales archaeon]
MNIFAISGLLITITCLSLFVFLLYVSKKRIHKLWSTFNLVVALWGVGTFLIAKASSPESALFAWRIALLGALFISVFFYHVVCVFGDFKRKKLLIYAYSSAIFINILNLTSGFFLSDWNVIFGSLYYPAANVFLYIMFLNWFVFVILGHYELFWIYRNSSGYRHLQSIYLLIGFLIGFIGGTFTLLPVFGINIYPFSNFTIPIYVLIVTYAILRHRLLDIRIVFKKSMVYSLSAGLLSGIFVIFVLTMTRLISNFAAISSFKISLI